jgi:hypothetical protein
MNLPELAQDEHWTAKASKPSVMVLINSPEWENMAVGRYYYGLEEWRIIGHNNSITVTEWWPLPERGTGNKP